MTRVCNNRCVFCLDADQQDGSVVSLFEIEEELRMGKKGGAERVVLSGGEPTLHKDFVTISNIFGELKQQGVYSVLNTNAQSIDKYLFLFSPINSGLFREWLRCFSYLRGSYKGDKRGS